MESEYWPTLAEACGRAPEPEPESADEETECQHVQCRICMERKIAIINPCGHCVCRTCHKKLKREHGWCPSCKRPWTGDRRIYLG